VRAHQAFIAGETLATSVEIVADLAADPQPVGEGGEVRVQVTRV
jgi:hypothetical protein